jgi:hypothetical protein
MAVTFAEWLTEAAGRGEVVNTLFEERLFELVGILHRISGTLEAGRIPHEVIGGLAVLLHVEEANPEHATLTRDVDIMVRREDLDRVKQAAQQAGFRFRGTRCIWFSAAKRFGRASCSRIRRWRRRRSW